MDQNLLLEEQETNILKFPSTPENIAIVENFIESIKDVHKIGEDAFGNIMIAITEAVNNAIIHGNKNDHNKLVAIKLTKDNQHLSFSVQDQGNGFDPNSLPDPTSPENLEKPTGRGVFLMKNLADKIEFHENGRNVMLHFKIQ